MSMLRAEHGLQSLDIVIVNAAVLISDASFRDIDMGDMEVTWKINVHIVCFISLRSTAERP
jgi:NAD(P)-dependent dehydrogenase (short-subunit alcohol dehydrogenase family)